MPTAERRPLLRREWQSLNHDQQGRVVALFERAPTLASAYVPRTPLTAIFNIARIEPPPRPAFSAGLSKSKS
ncbi:MAG: hypothetical protein RKO66_16740 [Candidatus Contendobacter sp.]|nr:hypothetical protein [Candidatus Contendobacter sp.]MDS4060435.1 hypothetical protein [Candidatus Contendobacter sp.]